MQLAEYCREERGFLLLPIERLSPDGSDADLAAFLRDDCGWSNERISLLDRSLALYWSRSRTLCEKTGAWPQPRIRNIGVAADGAALRPYAQILNTSTWSLYDCDLDPDVSNPEFAAYLLALGDWMAVTGEVTQAPVLSAAWWLEADEDAGKAFRQAAERCQRPDADGMRAVADALPWLANLRHVRLRPAGSDEVIREIPGTGLQVPVRHEARPPRLIENYKRAAVAAVEAYRRTWREGGAQALDDLIGWLARDAPLLVVTATNGRILWDPSAPGASEALASELQSADRVAVASIQEDLRLIDEHSRRFLAALAAPDALPTGDDVLDEGGYAYMHPARRMIAYNLHEPGMERLTGPPLPYERAMLGARVLHEWAHLADETGCVRWAVDDERLAHLRGTVAGEFAAAVDECDHAVADAARGDLDALAAGAPVGDALAAILLARLPDYRANLIARAFMQPSERETYARHNIRTLRREYTPSQLWRALVRYTYEYQYLLPGLSLTALDDPYRYFELSTGFGADFVERGAITPERFASLSAALSALLAVYAVDGNLIRLPRD